MAGKNFAFKTKHKELGQNVELITLENAASLTIFQLRQELTRRGIFDDTFGADGEKRNINFEACVEVCIFLRCFYCCLIMSGVLFFWFT